MALTKQTQRFIEDIRSPLARVLTLGKQDGADIGATDAMDVSDYEGANIIHDLNLPVPQSLHGQFDMVVDGGTLEHVWDVRTALDNCFAMVKDNGWFVSHQIGNFTGHGYWGLSPEAFWKWSLTKSMLNQQCWVYSPWTRILREVKFSVIDDQRLEFCTVAHFYFLFRARKQGPPLFDDPVKPQAGPAKPSSFLRRWLWETRLWRWPRV